MSYTFCERSQPPRASTGIVVIFHTPATFTADAAGAVTVTCALLDFPWYCAVTVATPLAIAEPSPF